MKGYINHSITNDIKIPVVYYHSVGPFIQNWTRSFLTLAEEAFREHLKYFHRNFTTITLKELWLIRNGYIRPVKNPLVITFDDGYSDNYNRALPLLKEYGIKATIFISPEFTDDRNIVRSEKDGTGFLSWKEMESMQESGLIDIQSHTLTHTKCFISDKITGFHHPGGDILYPTVNIFPERKTDHIGDPGFEKLLPYGFPLFEEASAVLARKVTINPDFISECISRFKNYDFGNYSFKDAFSLIKPLYKSYQKEERLITLKESDDEYLIRVRNEIYRSKEIIEGRLNKKVEFLCWPHGDNNEFLHSMALDAGYLMTTKGKARGVKDSAITRIPERMGVDFSSWKKKQKTVFKLKAFSGKFPYDFLLNTFRIVKWQR